MSAAIQLVNHSLIEAENGAHGSQNKSLERSFGGNVSIFESAPEQRLRRALGYITQLQSEVRTLREELARAERSVTHYEQLLRNAQIREQEIRKQLIKELLG